MAPKTMFAVFDNQMSFDRVETDMIMSYIHRYYPYAWRSVILQLRRVMQEMYKQAEGQITYSASHTQEEGSSRFQIREGFYSTTGNIPVRDNCNFMVTVDSTEPQHRKVYEQLQTIGNGPVDENKLLRHNPDFKKDLYDFGRFAASGSSQKNLFGKTNLEDICAFVLQLLNRFEKTIFVLDYKLDVDTRTLDVVFANRESKTHVITVSATDFF